MCITKENFQDIVKQHERILFKVSNSYCADPDDRKDIVQEIIVQIWNSKHRYNPEYKISTWIYRIALNVAISQYRKSSKRKVSVTALSENLIETVEDLSGTEELDHNLELLQKFIHELDKLNKAPILLYLEEYS